MVTNATGQKSESEIKEVPARPAKSLPGKEKCGAQVMLFSSEAVTGRTEVS